MTTVEIGTIVLGIILWFWFPNFSQMCHGGRICHKSTFFVERKGVETQEAIGGSYCRRVVSGIRLSVVLKQLYKF